MSKQKSAISQLADIMIGIAKSENPDCLDALKKSLEIVEQEKARQAAEAAKRTRR